MNRVFLSVAAALVAVAVAAGFAAARGAIVVQPDAARGKATFVMYRADKPSGDCANWGGYSRLHVGANALSVRRGLIQFDLSSIPSSAHVTSATLSLYHPDALRGSGTVEVHRVTSSWPEGTGVNTCTGDGATWNTPWGAAGGDFSPTVAASLAKSAGNPPGWDNWNLTALVQQWVSRSVANNGLLLKLSNESYSPCTTPTNCNYWAYATDDWPDASLRPKLTITTS